MTDRIRAADLKAALRDTDGKQKRQDREGPIHLAILDLVRLMLPGAVINHSPNETDMSGPQAARMVAKAKKLGMRPGYPDIAILWRGQFWTFEVKPPGAHPTSAQIECGRDIVENGGRWAVVRSVDEALRFLTMWIEGMPEPVQVLQVRGVVR